MILLKSKLSARPWFITVVNISLMTGPVSPAENLGLTKSFQNQRGVSQNCLLI